MDQLAQQLANGIIVGSVYGLIAVSLALIYGVLGISQFAIGSMAALGGYVVFLTSHVVGYWVSLLLAMLAIGLLGGLVQRLVFQPLRQAPASTVFVAAYGLLVIFQGGALVIWGPNPRNVDPGIDGGFQLLGARITWQQLIIFVIVILVVIVLSAMLRLTQFGRKIRATGQNPTGALVVGISTTSIAIVTMGIGGALAGLAGGLLAPISQVSPTAGSDLVIKGFIIVVLAGMGSIWGSLAAAYFVGLVEALGAAYISAEFSDLYSLALLLLVLLFRPSGLFSKASARV